MRLDPIPIADVVLAKIKRRSIYGEVLEIGDNQVNFRPLCPGDGSRHAKWGRSDPEAEPSAVPKEQLSL